MTNSPSGASLDVLSVTSECAPLVKTGGLADVAGALPGALAPHGVAMRTLLPGYRAVMAEAGRSRTVMEEADLFGGPARVQACQVAGLDLLVLDAPHLYDRDGSPYLDASGADWPDNPQRFAALSYAGARIAAQGLEDWRPRVLHCHDWQAGLAPVHLATHFPDAAARSVMTIHNVAFQGRAPADRVDVLRLPADGLSREGFEFWGEVSALKAGLVWADAVTTVSPTYAAELTRPEFGMGMEGVIAARRADLRGILNGVDLDAWAPPFASARGKAKFKAKLRRAFGLAETAAREWGPLCVVVSRLSQQKGIDLLLDAAPRLLDEGGQLLVLGTGDAALEERLEEAADRHPNMAVRIGYDEALARLMIQGGDAILVPSRFEPCGLTQLYGLLHGTLPLVARTGGLADTVIDANPAAQRTGVATGVQFAPATADALSHAFDRLVALWREPKVWARMQANAMRQPVGWDESAAHYAALYRSLADPAAVADARTDGNRAR